MKKLTLTLLALVCALCCFFGLAACDENGSAEIEHLYVTDGTSDAYAGNTGYFISIEYGKKPDLSKYKLFLLYTDHSASEIARTDEKLSVKYYFYTAFSSADEKQEISALPDDLIYGSYIIEYTYNDEQTAEVLIGVAQAQSGAFTVQAVGGATWSSQGAPRKVIVKNPKGAEVKMEWVDGSPKPAEKTNDTDGDYTLYLFQKSVYDGFTEKQKTDYDFLYDYWSTDNNASEHKVYMYMPEFSDVVGVPEGEYMLLALIGNTHNYHNVATPAVQITVTP